MPTYTFFVSLLIDDARFQEGAYADVSVKLGLIKILQKQFDLCQEAYVSVIFIMSEMPTLISLRRNANTSVQCPVEKGAYKVVHTVTLPKEIPQGKSLSLYTVVIPDAIWSAKFNIGVQGYTVEDDNLFCVNLKVDFMKRPFLKLPLGW